MAGGTAIEFFTDFVLNTGPAFLKGPEDIVNDAVKSTYTLPRFIYGKSMKDMVQGGNSIKDNILLGADSNAQNYKPNAEFNYRNPQVLSQWSVPWRFTKDEMVWTDQEIGLNTGEMSRGARHHKFKTLKYSKEQNLYTGLLEFLDDQFWAAPDTTEMEGTDGETPLSLPCFITETGIAADVSTGTLPTNGPDGTAWATVMGIDPAVKTGWQNQAIKYASIGAATGTAPHLFNAFSKTYYKTKFERLPRRGDLSDPTSVPHFIGASLTGISNYEDALRINQDTFVATGRQDPAFAGPQFRGIEMVYMSDLDTAALYEDSTGGDGNLATEALADITGARYYWVNGKYILKVIHSDRYFFKKRPFSPSKQPYTHICIVDVWHNNVCRSRKRQAIVTPKTDL